MNKQRGIVLTPYIAIVVAVVVVGLITLVWFKDKRIESLSQELGKEKQSRIAFETAAKNCSESVAKLAELAATAEKTWRAKQVESRKKAKATESYVTDLLTRQRPAGMDECTATREELNEEVIRRIARR